MTAAHQPLTLRELHRRWQTAVLQGQPAPAWLLGDFIDDFRLRARTPEEKSALTRDEPDSSPAVAGENLPAYLAAMAEALCREAGLAPPAWTEKPAYFLPRPWFAGGLQNLKAILLVESPAAFRRRNLFVSADALSRV